MVFARSNAEAEFMSMAHGVCELLRLKMFLAELGYLVSCPLALYCNNKVVINIAHNPVLHDRAKHIEVDCHFIKEWLRRGCICTSFVKTRDQLEDVLMKGLSGTDFLDIVDKQKMRDIYSPA